LIGNSMGASPLDAAPRGSPLEDETRPRNAHPPARRL
jgi:hypothetical protein